MRTMQTQINPTKLQMAPPRDCRSELSALAALKSKLEANQALREARRKQLWTVVCVLSAFAVAVSFMAVHFLSRQ